MATLQVLESALAGLRLSSPTFTAANQIGRRNASHQAQGRANKAADGPGKRLGAKKTGGEYVVPGNIIFKQRGTLWFPGDNCSMVCHALHPCLHESNTLTLYIQGRDHTIHAAQPGYVRYYRDPARHPKRKFIGIVFEKNQQLPAPLNAVRRRKLGMLAYQQPAFYTEQTTGDLLTGQETGLPGNAEQGEAKSSTIREEPNESRAEKVVKDRVSGEVVEGKLTLRPGYQYRQANWEIGRAAERSKAALSVKPFQPGDRFAAWRKRSVRVARNAERRAMGRGGKKSGKK